MEASTLSSPLLPWDKFSNWLHCVCVVTFDLELGQALELLYPAHAQLSDAERTSLCYLAFPDSNSGCMGDTCYHFRFREQGMSLQSNKAKGYSSSYWHRPSPLNRELLQFNQEAPAYLQATPGYYYGFVYFRQIRDHTVRRGYFQKSVVLVSRLPLVALFRHLVSCVAPEFFKSGPASLEAACHDIDQWPPPCPGAQLALPLLGSVLQLRLPARSDKLLSASSATNSTLSLLQSDSENLPPMEDQPEFDVRATSLPAGALAAEVHISSPHEVNLFNALQPILPHIQLLWELVLLAEPLLVLAPNPDISAELVQALVSSIQPLRCATDYRPYFTIHDCEFREYTSKTQAPPPVILGVTNPFFAKALRHWPHIVRVGDSIGGAPKDLAKVRKGTDLKTLDCQPGVYTRYKPFLVRDKQVIKRIYKGIQRGRQGEVQTAILRRFFLELTQSFMIPLERYVASLMPLARAVRPFKGVPRLRPFSADEFLSSLQHSGPQLTCPLRGDWTGLYRRFLGSAHCATWLAARQTEVQAKLEALHTEALCEADLAAWASQRQRLEVEVVDLVLKLQEKVAAAKRGALPISEDCLRNLVTHIETLVAGMPEDLKAVMRSAPRVGCGAGTVPVRRRHDSPSTVLTHR